MDFRISTLILISSWVFFILYKLTKVYFRHEFREDRRSLFSFAIICIAITIFNNTVGIIFNQNNDLLYKCNLPLHVIHLLIVLNLYLRNEEDKKERESMKDETKVSYLMESIEHCGFFKQAIDVAVARMNVDLSNISKTMKEESKNMKVHLSKNPTTLTGDEDIS